MKFSMNVFWVLFLSVNVSEFIREITSLFSTFASTGTWNVSSRVNIRDSRLLVCSVSVSRKLFCRCLDLTNHGKHGINFRVLQPMDLHVWSSLPRSYEPWRTRDKLPCPSAHGFTCLVLWHLGFEK